MTREQRNSTAPLWLGLAVLSLILVTAAALNFWNTSQIDERAKAVAHSRNALVDADAILIALVDAETGERGFLLTGDSAFLQPYDAAIARIPGLIADLRNETGQRPSAQERITALNQKVGDRLDALKSGIERKRRAGGAAFDINPSAQDKAMMDGIRTQLAGIQADENEVLKQRRLQRTSAFEVALAAGVITAVLALLAVGALAWVVIRNLAARQRDAARLHEQSELLRTTLLSIGDGVIATNTEGLVTFLNSAAEALTGWKQADANGKRLHQVFNIVHEQTREPAVNPVTKVLESGVVVGLANHTVLIARDGSETPIDDSAAPIRDAEGTVRGVVLVFRDVSERKQLEKIEKDANLRLRRVLDSVPQKLFTATPEGVIDYSNPFWAHFSGLTAAERLDWSWTRIVHPDDFDDMVRAWKHSIKTGEPFENTHRFQRIDGEYRWHISRAVAIRDANGSVLAWVGANNDIHEEKALANELRVIATDLSQADTRKNEFLAVLAHELRNPLAPIRNSAQVLRANGEAIQKASVLMERQIGQMVRLVDDLLDVSRISLGKIELRKSHIELGSAIKDAIDTAAPQLANLRLALTAVLPEEPIYLDADPARLAQIIGNLLSNAGKFTDQNGQIRLSIERENDEAVIRVQDNGIGIASDQLPRIFQMFMQVDTALHRSEGGLGIGLSLVKTLAELHGGRVEVASPGIGMGTTFTVRLPIAAENAPLPASTADLAPASISGRRILIVDDNADSAESLEMLLKMGGNDTHIAHDGVAAIEAADRYRPEVMLLDIGLPKLNGYQVAEKIRSEPWGKDIVLIALTGWGQEDDRRRSAEAGFNAHMVKPIAYEALMSLLAEHGVTA